MLNWKQRRSILLISVSIFGMLALTIAGIYPSYSMGVKLNQKIKAIEQKIEIQQVMTPVYKELLKRLETTALNGLDYPPTVIPATPEDIERFSGLMDEIATRNAMVLKQMAPDADAYVKDGHSIGMNIALIGDFFHFRQLLIRLCRIAFIKEIESIRIYIDDHGYIYELRLIIAQK